MLNTCTIALSKFIMHVWLNLEDIRYYERHDQFKKMVYLLKGIDYLLSIKHLFPSKTCASIDLYIHEFRKSERNLIRHTLAPSDMYHSKEMLENKQSINVTTSRNNYESK